MDHDQHEHFCPVHQEIWVCHETITVYQANEDASGYADCRWHREVVCPNCLKRRQSPTGRDVHADAARVIFGSQEPTVEQRKSAKNANYRHLFGGTVQKPAPTPLPSSWDFDYGSIERRILWSDRGFNVINRWANRAKVVWSKLVILGLRLYEFDPEKLLNRRQNG